MIFLPKNKVYKGPDKALFYDSPTTPGHGGLLIWIAWTWGAYVTCPAIKQSGLPITDGEQRFQVNIHHNSLLDLYHQS